MDYKINQRILEECLDIMERQYKKIELCFAELENHRLRLSLENHFVEQSFKDMELQMQEIWKLRRNLERVLVHKEQREQKILEKLDGKQRRSDATLGNIEFGRLSEIMEELQIWIQ